MKKLELKKMELVNGGRVDDCVDRYAIYMLISPAFGVSLISRCKYEVWGSDWWKY